MDWTVRAATSADAEAVKAVAAAGWRDTYAGLLRDATIEAFLAGPYAIDNVRERIAGHEFLVAGGPEGIAAYADAVPEAERIFLAAIYAQPQWRGQGAGTALLEEITRRHPDLPIDAYVLLGNRKGETFYERRGFVPDETIEGDLFGEPVTERRWRRPAASPGPQSPNDPTIRSATAADLPFLAETLVEAAYPPWIDPKPTPTEALADPGLAVTCVTGVERVILRSSPRRTGARSVPPGSVCSRRSSRATASLTPLPLSSRLPSSRIGADAE